MRSKNNPKIIDLFSGSGGLSFGFAEAGFEIVAGIDNWKDSLVTFEKNHPGAKGILADLGNFKPEKIPGLPKKIDVIVGGPPCQGFSISGKRNPNDRRNRLYVGFANAVKYFRPKAFLLENVPNLIAMADGKIKDAILNDFNALGYDIKYKILLASDYGVPQNRKRVVFIGTRGRNGFEFPTGKFTDPQLKVTCGQAISDLPAVSLEDGAKNKRAPCSEYQELMRRKTDAVYNHQITNHEERTIATIKLVPEGGNYKDLPARLRNTRKVHIAWTRYHSGKPSYTIDTGHRHHFHYKYDRIPTVRESARLQSFPDHFIFCGTKTSQYKQVGNAVPPLMAEEIAKSMLKIL